MNKQQLEKFKIGDYVIRTSGEHAGMKIGNIGLVVEKCLNPTSLVIQEYKGSDGKWAHNPINLRFVTKEEIQKYFKTTNMIDIKEFRVIKDFPTATKDWKVGEIVKKGTALFKKAYKFPQFFEPVENKIEYKEGDYVVLFQECIIHVAFNQCVGEVFQLLKPSNRWPTLVNLDVAGAGKNGGNSDGGYYLSKSFIRKATPAEIKKFTKIKVGDWVTDDNALNYYKVGEIRGTYYILSEDSRTTTNQDVSGIVCGSSLRKLTKEEIIKAEIFYLSLNKKQIKNLGTNNITLEWDGKDKLRIVQKGSDTISLKALTKWYEEITILNRVSIGSYHVSFFDKNARTILIGCSEEKNLVSLNEILKVINFCK